MASSEGIISPEERRKVAEGFLQVPIEFQKLFGEIECHEESAGKGCCKDVKMNSIDCLGCQGIPRCLSDPEKSVDLDDEEKSILLISVSKDLAVND